MSRDLNSVVLIGRLTRDPEIKYTAAGKAICNFSIAVNDNYGDKKQSYFFSINVWGASGENCSKFLRKGSQVCVLGSLRQDRWEDKASGKGRSSVSITAKSVQFLTKAEPSKQNEPQPQTIPDLWGNDSPPMEEDNGISF